MADACSAAGEPSPHTAAYIDMDAKLRLWRGFAYGAGFFMLHILMIVGYLTLVLAVKADWLVSLVIVAVLGAVIGALVKLGRLWMMFVVAFVVAILVARVGVSLGGLLLQ